MDEEKETGEEKEQENGYQESESKQKTEKRNPFLYSTIAMVILLISVVFLTPRPTGMVVSVDKNIVGNKVVDYINKNLVQSGSASLVSVEDMGSFYKVMTSYQGRQIPVYASKDGKYLFTGFFNMSETKQVQQQSQTQTQEVPKSDRPDVHVFVMSYCPFGLQFLKAYIPVMELLGDKTDLQINFVDYAMHGKKEVDENTIIYCIQKEQKDTLTQYLRCFVQSGNHTECADKSGIDSSKLDTCISEADEQYNITNLYNDKSTWLNGRFPQFLIDKPLNDKYGVRGSPTFVINGKTVSVTRSPEAIKDAICNAFNNPPTECNTNLSTTVESPGIGPIGSGEGSSSSGQC